MPLQRIPEPQTPGEAKRMTPQEKQFLQCQRTLDSAISRGNTTTIALMKTRLGDFDDAPEIHEALRTKELCGCAPISLAINDGTQEVLKQVSCYTPVMIYPQGTLWRCTQCNHMTILVDPPDDLALALQVAQTNFSERGKGHDILALPNIPKEL